MTTKGTGYPGQGLNAVAVAFGRTLQRARTTAGLSQEELAERAEIDRTYPSLMERGLRQPTLAVLLRLAPALRTTVGQLAADTESHQQGHAGAAQNRLLPPELCAATGATPKRLGQASRPRAAVVVKLAGVNCYDAGKRRGNQEVP